VVQACHASLEAAKAFPFREHPNIIVCGIRDEQRLNRCLDRLTRYGIRSRAFHEPDRDGELTALATEPVLTSQRRVFRDYPLLQGNG
jgi:hypothetical protein